MVAEPDRSYVVTGASGGVGAAIVERLAMDGAVVAFDRVSGAWSSDRVRMVVGDASSSGDVAVALAAAEELAPLAGWVNNAAVFEDASLATVDAGRIVEAVTANLAMAVVGTSVAVRSFLDAQRGGSIVKVSSHQALRPVRGALPYSTAKAAIEGFTRAVAVDHGPDSIRCNSAASGSIATARDESYRADHPEVDVDMARRHPIGRVGTATEVAEVVAFLLSGAASFVNGAVVPVDGGWSVFGLDPEGSDE